MKHKVTKGYKTMGGAIEAAHKMNVPVIAVWQERPENGGPLAGRWNWAAAGAQHDQHVRERNLAVTGSRRVVMVAVAS